MPTAGRRRLILAGILGVLSMAGLAPLFERLFGRTRLRFPYAGRPLAEASYARLAGEPGWSKATLDVAPGIQLRGLVRSPTSPDAAWVLFYPGNDESQLERGHAFLSALGAGTDWGLAVFAYRGYDSSPGKSELSAIRTDAPEILAKLCAAQHLSPSRVHLAGFSIGGHFSVQAARGAALQGRRAASLTLLAPVDDIVMFDAGPWEKFSRGDDYQTRPLLAEVPGPVLVVQGTADEALQGPEQGRAIAQRLGDRARYEQLEGVGHVALLANPRALEIVRQFIAQHAH